jgi:hypothetical protein
VFCKASFLLVADLEDIGDRFLPFRAVTACIQELPNLRSTLVNSRQPEKDYGDGGVVSVGAVAGDSVVVVVSVEAVAVGLAPGATVSVLCSQAASIPPARMIQMYFVIAGLYAKSAFA